ncbi:MAG TPA: serine/threonine-protein kinase, partial [Kofleriaceae bacterium]
MARARDGGMSTVPTTPLAPVASDASDASDAPDASDASDATEPVAWSSITGRRTGQQVGRYKLYALLGAGAMGEVWVATDPQLERNVAIKLVHPKLARHPEASARMVREARAMAKVSHRGVIAIHDAGDANGQLFLAMELVRGRTLGALLRARTPDDVRDWRKWLAIAIDAGRGLAAAHAAGVLHRDFKPDNVMVDDTGRVCVGDFGLATLGDAPEHASDESPAADDRVEPALTAVGALLGTPAYMSLEQLRGEAIDARADLFSFCVTAYEAVYGDSPFVVASDDQGNLAALQESRLDALRPAPADARVPAELRAILVRGLAAMPAERWPDLDTLLDALVAVLARTQARPRRGVAFALAGMAVLAAAAGVWVLTRAAPHAKSLGPVSTTAAIALSPGDLLAIGTDRVTVRDLESDEAKPKLFDFGTAWVRSAQFDGDRVLRWGPGSSVTPGV